MLFNNERCPLLLKYFMIFLKCIRKVRGASESIYKPFMGHIVPLMLRPTLKLLNKIPDLGYPTLSQQIMGWSTAEIDIHCSWSISYPAFSYILKVGWASGSIFEPLIVHMVPFLSKSTLKLHANCQIWCALSAQEMGCYITMRGIHCWWSGPYPSWNVWDR